jgi:hypothetical protein
MGSSRFNMGFPFRFAEAVGGTKGGGSALT